MTTTILRHEFTRTIRPLLVIMGVGALMTLLANTMGLFVGVIGLLLGAMVVTVMLPAIQFFLAIDFYRISYGVGAILTHSLPVTGRRLFWTKMLYATLVSVGVGIFSLVLFFIHVWVGLYAANVPVSEAYAAVQQLFTQMTGMWPLVIFSVAWVLIMPIAAMFSSVVIGSGSWARRLSFGGPVIVFVSYYLIIQILSAVSFFIPPVYDFGTGDVQLVSMWHLITGGAPDPVMPLPAVAMQIVVLAVLVVWASRNIHSKVELHQ